MKKLLFEIIGRVISKKNSKRMMRNRRTGKMFPVSSTAYVKFKRNALKQIDEIDTRFDKPVHIDYLFCTKGKQKIDIDNAMASINDILEDAQILQNDSLIKSTYAKLEHGYTEWKTYIRIIEL